MMSPRPQQGAPSRTVVRAALDFNSDNSDSDGCSDLDVSDNGSDKAGDDSDEPDDSEYFNQLSQLSPIGPLSPTPPHISVLEAGKILAARAAEQQKTDQPLTEQEKTEKRHQRQRINSRRFRQNEKAKAAAGLTSKPRRKRGQAKPRCTIYMKADNGKPSRPNLERIPHNHPKITFKELARRKAMTDSGKFGCAKCGFFWHCCKDGGGKLWTPLIKMSDIIGS